jgi:hypothetical protein
MERVLEGGGAREGEIKRHKKREIMILRLTMRGEREKGGYRWRDGDRGRGRGEREYRRYIGRDGEREREEGYK